MKRTEMRRTRKKPTKAEVSGRAVVMARCGGHCEFGACQRTDLDWSHRVRRSQGGTWLPSNGLALCREHHRWITESPLAGNAVGLSLPANSDPLLCPVMRRCELVFLDDAGGIRKATPEEHARWAQQRLEAA